MIIQLKNITKIFNNNFIALKDISLDVFKEDFLIIAGSNGSGKTLLMNLIAKLDKPTSGTIHTTKVGLIFQDSDTQILGETPLEDILFTLDSSKKYSTFTKEQKTIFALDLLTKFNLYNKKDFYTHLLSGGEKKRLCIASTLAMNTEVLIFDEPFANLDYTSIKQVCNILKQLKNDNKTIILLTHETEKILALANRVAVLHNGSIKFNGSPNDFLLQDTEQWQIKNPLQKLPIKLEDLIWL